MNADGTRSRFGLGVTDASVLPVASAGQVITSESWNTLLDAMIRVERGGSMLNMPTRTMQYAGVVPHPGLVLIRWGETLSSPLYNVLVGSLSANLVLQGMLQGQVSAGQLFHPSTFYAWSCVHRSSSPTQVPFQASVWLHSTDQRIYYYLMPLHLANSWNMVSAGYYEFTLLAFVP